MTNDRPVESNPRNASTGPRTGEGKAKSRVNATKHGLAGASVGVEAGLSPAYQDRRAKWAAEHQPVGQAAEWALDRAVAASFQIERCERAIEDHTRDVRMRANLAWEEDRAIEAATILGKLGRDPVLASRQLRATLAGVVLLIEAWLALVDPLRNGDDRSESESAKALDLLGMAPDARSGRTRIDGPDPSGRVAFRLAMALEEVDRLEDLRDEAMIPLDELERGHAMAGDIALLSDRAKLLLRYERDAWKRHREAMKEVKDSRSAAPVVPPAPRPAPAPRPVASPTRSFEEERRALLAEAAPYRLEATEELVAPGFADEDAWLDELERRLEGVDSLPGSFVPIAAGRPGRARQRILASA